MRTPKPSTLPDIPTDESIAPEGAIFLKRPGGDPQLRARVLGCAASGCLAREYAAHDRTPQPEYGRPICPGLAAAALVYAGVPASVQRGFVQQIDVCGQGSRVIVEIASPDAWTQRYRPVMAA